MEPLTMLILLPLIGAVLTYVFGKGNEESAKHIALLFSLLTLLASIPLIPMFMSNPESLYPSVNYKWLTIFDKEITFSLGVDGLSLPMILLTTVLFVVAILASWNRITYRLPEYYALMLLMEMGLIGIYESLDLFFFYVFWEFVLIPGFFLIGIWGGKEKTYAAMKFFIYTHVGSLFMLIGFLKLLFATNTTNIIAIEKTLSLSIEEAKLVFLLLFIGFAFKIPFVPFHTWLPHAYTQAPSPVTLILAALVSKMGAYGLIRLAFSFFEDFFQLYSYPLALLGLLSIFYAGFLALAQDDIKKLIAYSSVSHMGFVLLGLLSFNLTGLNGAIFQMVSHGLIVAMLFLACGIMNQHLKTRLISQLSGVARSMPKVGWSMVYASMASIGLPGLSGFVAELLILFGLYNAVKMGIMPLWVLVLAALSIGLTTGYYSFMLQRAIFNSPNDRVKKVKEVLTSSEAVALAVLIILIAFLGLYPFHAVEIISQASEKLLAR